MTREDGVLVGLDGTQIAKAKIRTRTERGISYINMDPRKHDPKKIKMAGTGMREVSLEGKLLREIWK